MKSQNKNRRCKLVAVFLALLGAVAAHGQGATPLSEQLAVTARTSLDSITLRWAPLNFKAWRTANTYGYRVERYVIARNGAVLRQPEKSILRPVVRPWPETEWESLVRSDRYAAIAAQALYGDRFEVALDQSDVFTIVDKVKENEQRFAFALFSADLSPQVAVASGLWLTDKNIRKGDKYLYRIVINSPDSIRGSVYLSPEDPYTLPRPQNLKGDFKEQLVSLRWNKSVINCYTAYLVERSVDGKIFTSISDTPLVTVSPLATQDTRFEYAIDSLKVLAQTYHYRVKGITPFGEHGPPSDVISGKGTPAVSRVPMISAVENHNNKTLLIHWDFPVTDNDAIGGFTVERSAQATAQFTKLNSKMLPPRTRSYEDKLPGQVNYYRVTAHGLDHAPYTSHLYFAQLIDSMPPSPPSGLQATVSDSGLVMLSWKANTERDIFGYRIYKAFHVSEELAQVTSAPHAGTTYTDPVDLHTLNETVYYSVMAIDISQNHSDLSSLLKVVLPDKIPPQPPVFLPATSSPEGVALHWAPGASEDIAAYTVYRKRTESAQWEQITNLKADHDSIQHYLDETASSREVNIYTVVAVDEAGLESEPAAPVKGVSTRNALRPAITWKRPRINPEENEITLLWDYDQPQIHSLRIYRAVDAQPPVMFKTLAGEVNDFTDTMIPGRRYSYRIMAIFSDGLQSSLSTALEFQY